MKKIFLLFLVFFALGASAQKLTSGLLFCPSVDDKFQPVNATAEIALKNNRAEILFYYWNDMTPRSASITYKTYAIGSTGKETLSGTIVQDVQPAWRFVKQNAVFTHTGKYHVKVFSPEGKELASALLTVK